MEKKVKVRGAAKGVSSQRFVVGIHFVEHA